jgi:hypothetical protein
MEAVFYCKTSVNFYQTTWFYFSEYGTPEKYNFFTDMVKVGHINNQLSESMEQSSS